MCWTARSAATSLSRSFASSSPEPARSACREVRFFFMASQFWRWPARAAAEHAIKRAAVMSFFTFLLMESARLSRVLRREGYMIGADSIVEGGFVRRTLRGSILVFRALAIVSLAQAVRADITVTTNVVLRAATNCTPMA